MRRAVLLALACIALAGCGGARHTAGRTVWLCRPGLADDPCAGDLSATVVSPGGAAHVERVSSAADAPVDCFYVYPTVSAQQTVNANLVAGLREREVAVAQAARFSQVCRVYAPVYRQITLAALDHPGRIRLANALLAYDDVRAAFDDYLARWNHGRGFVLIGHSQGAVILTRLVQERIDHDPSVRRRLVSALILGGNVTTADFAHVPTCRSRTQTGCVVAYSSFAGTPPANAQFARATSNAGLPLLAPRRRAPIVCVDPAAPGGGEAALDPYLPSLVLLFLHSTLHPTTPWVAFPGAYTARCRTAGDATWLDVERVGHPSPDLTRLRDPALGLHVLDVNLALGNLVALVRSEAAAYRG
ncbi:MAG: DUF3089 domain-containing protein [Actinobacteria bacterium]|nr:DUF3089 domain-containing protein [Actinomycetota bacterium]